MRRRKRRNVKYKKRSLRILEKEEEEVLKYERKKCKNMRRRSVKI